MSQSEVVTVRLTPEIKAKLDALATSTHRSQSWLVAQAIALYVEQESTQIQMIEAAVKIADSPQTQWIEGSDVLNWLETWGRSDEKPAPCA
jgi:predicted transcriptional regulator